MTHRPATLPTARNRRLERLARLQVAEDRRTAATRVLHGRRAPVRRPAVVPPVGFEPTLSVV